MKTKLWLIYRIIEGFIRGNSIISHAETGFFDPPTFHHHALSRLFKRILLRYVTLNTNPSFFFNIFKIWFVISQTLGEGAFIKVFLGVIRERWGSYFGLGGEYISYGCGLPWRTVFQNLWFYTVSVAFQCRFNLHELNMPEAYS